MAHHLSTKGKGIAVSRPRHVELRHMKTDNSVTHSQAWHYTGHSNQLHAPAVLARRNTRR